MFMHKNWSKTNVLETVVNQASKRNLKDLTIGPVLTWTNENIKKHIDDILLLEDTKLLCGGKPLTGHSIPSVYGAWEPTLVYVPLKHFRNSKKY